MQHFRKLNNPAKIQDFLNSLKFNFEKSGDTLSSPATVFKRGSAHCFEGAILGAYLLSQIPARPKHKPLVMCLRAAKPDVDHVVAPFRVNGYWGALSKTNHAVLRYREPVYKTLRELALSYFHEYFLNDGTKTLRQFSDPLDLSVFADDWANTDDNLWGIDEELDRVTYHDIVPKTLRRNLRKADHIEREAGKITEQG
jgi:hypothetical protein